MLYADDGGGFVVCNLIVDLLNAALDPRIRRMKEPTRELFPLFPLVGTPGVIIIALLALIALTSQWWLPYTHRRLICRRACFHRMRSTGWYRSFRARYFLAADGGDPRVVGSVMACLLLVLTLGLVIGGAPG